MKKYILIALALSCFSTQAQVAARIGAGINQRIRVGNAIVSTPVSEPTPDVLWWKMNEGSGMTFTADVGVNGTTSGGSGYVTGADGAATHAFNFGGDTTANSVSSVTYGVNVITVTFWAYSTAWATGTPMLLNSSGGTSTANTWLIDNDEGTIRLIFRGTTTSLLRYESFAAPSNSAWHHFAIVFDGSTATGEITCYVDGASQATSVVQSDRDGTSNFGAETLYVGNASGASFWGGYMDDVRIYTTALSAGQVAAIYANPE